MDVRELTREQLNELKVDYVFKQFRDQDEMPSYEDIANATDIDDEVIFEEYGGIHFVEEDFVGDSFFEEEEE